MKKIVASVGLVALGTSGLHADSTAGLTSDSPKPWSISATLRGFYDDNINSRSGSGNLVYNGTTYHRGSFGFEASPAIRVSWPWEQTSLSFGYVYSFKDYEHRPIGNSDSYDQTHSFDAALHHNFNENYYTDVKDSFVVGQEPDFLRTGNDYTTFSRVSGDNIRNAGSISVDGTLTPLLGFEVGYANSFYNYADDSTMGGTVASYSGLLDRQEHTIHLDSHWVLQPTTVGVVGYQFSDVEFSGDQIILPGSTVKSDFRNVRSHYGYAGLDQTFRPDLTGSARVGARYSEYFNQTGSPTETDPYVQLSLRWVYALESSVEVGFTHDRSATDLVGNETAGRVTSGADTSIVYASVKHRLTSNLYGSVIGQYQDAVYSGGQYNNLADQYYTVGLDLEYRFNTYISANLGYSYDKLDSDMAGREFDRNRVYLGVTASY